MKQYGPKWTKFICFFKNRHTFERYVGTRLITNFISCEYCGVEFRDTSFGIHMTVGPIRKDPF